MYQLLSDAPSRFRPFSGCNLSTFDTESELHKIKELFPESNLVLRIRADDPNARCQLGNKFGAESEDVAGLLQLAKNLSLTVVGISFHVGSGATDPLAFKGTPLPCLKKSSACAR